MKILKAALMFFLAGTAAQAAPFMGVDSFTHEKSGYVVAVSQLGSRMVLNGRNPRTGQTFKLVVSQSGNVDGVWEGKALNYKLSPAAQQELGR